MNLKVLPYTCNGDRGPLLSSLFSAWRSSTLEGFVIKMELGFNENVEAGHRPELCEPPPPLKKLFEVIYF